MINPSMRLKLMAVLLWQSSSSQAAGLPVSGLKCGRRYDGIGGLSNSCAPWLRGYNASVLSDIMDVLFKPRWAGAAQVLKLEIGGDAHSTINTESSFMHVEDPAKASFSRGWENMLAVEAKKRNPNIKIGGLAWGWPGWTKGDLNKKTAYLTDWVSGMKKELNITVDYIGLQNEGVMTGGDEQASIALRKALDTAGHNHTQIECCDNHNFNGLPTDPTTDYYKAVHTYGIHEPLRNAEAVPAKYSATGKPIWSSESYTTYSDSNGGGCWARALNWGYVLGNVTSHTAWNLIQAYPSVGDDMNYNGHGLMWSEQPWSGFYVVNSPIWAMAHYTQATEPGWHYLPVGAGSGMLATGGSYVSLASEGGCYDEEQEQQSQGGVSAAVEYTLIIQAMEWGMSKCFKDTHARFDVAAESNLSFVLDATLLAALAEGRNNNNNSSSSTGTANGDGITLYARRTLLRADDVVLPARSVPADNHTNRYFESMPVAPLATDGPKAGVIEVTIRANEIWTISTVIGAGSRGDGTAGPNNGLAPIAAPRLWQEASPVSPQCFALTGHPPDSPLVVAVAAIDQQGVWEAGPSRDAATKATTMQQAVPIPPDEWHGGGGQHPYSFVGPAVNLSASTSDAQGGSTVSVDVLPSASLGGWAGVGFGRPASKQAPNDLALRVFFNGSWAFAGHSGVVPAPAPPAAARGAGDGAGAATATWYSLSLTIAPWLEAKAAPSYSAKINGKVVASGSAWATSHRPTITSSFATLSSSYSEGSNSEFKNLCLDLIESDTPRVRPGPGPGPSPPAPGPKPKGHGVMYVDGSSGCATNTGEFWTFSGEDKGEAGTLRPTANGSLCLDLDGKYTEGELTLVVCASDPSSATYKSQRWTYNSSNLSFTGVETRKCQKASHGQQCHYCLDVKSGKGVKGTIDLFDCKPGDGNQQWSFDVAGGAGPLTHSSEACLAATV